MPDEQRAHEQVGSPRAAQLGVARQAVRVDTVGADLVMGLGLALTLTLTLTLTLALTLTLT